LRGGEGGEQAAEVVEVAAFFELEVKVPFGEVEVGEPVLIHELDDAADFLEFHSGRRLGVGMNERRSDGIGLVGAS
jgi:alpha-D-ribose 1-methylphosphonate 5-triphosphate synthase subunit PhnI